MTVDFSGEIFLQPVATPNIDHEDVEPEAMHWLNDDLVDEGELFNVPMIQIAIECSKMLLVISLATFLFVGLIAGVSYLIYLLCFSEEFDEGR